MEQELGKFSPIRLDESGSFPSDTSNVVQPDTFNAVDMDMLLHEGELLRLNFQSTTKTVPRWCKLTKTEFKYYKNIWSANTWLSKPMLAASLDTIVRVGKIKPAPKNAPKFLFEIQLSQSPEMKRMSANLRRREPTLPVIDNSTM
jgi:hypothetical protein